jgi:hypothetical protein
MKLTRILASTAFLACIVGANAQGGPLRGDVEQLITDVKAALADSTVTQEQILTLKSAVVSAVDGAHKPNPAAVQQLVAVIKLAKKDGVITDTEKTKISNAILNVFASAGVPPSEVAALKSALQSIWYSANISQEELQIILNDIRQIIADLPPRP